MTPIPRPCFRPSRTINLLAIALTAASAGFAQAPASAPDATAIDPDEIRAGRVFVETDPPFPPSPVIAGLRIDWSSHQRLAVGSDNWQTTWADDDHMYTAWGDGGGVGAIGRMGRVGLGYARIEGDARGFGIRNVWGGFEPENSATFNGKSWGTIAVDSVLYSWVVPDGPDTGGPRDHYRYIELARSTDHAATWTKADWRWWCEDDLLIPTFLVFGKNNAGARDDFVYSYFIRPQRPGVTQEEFGLEIHRPGAIYLARVPQSQIYTGREAYQWFTGLDDQSQPRWGGLDQKQPVLESPAGTGWCVSAIYNPGLGRYLLATEHTVAHAGLLGIYDAPEPWGPWTTVAHWTPSRRFGQERPGSRYDWKDNVFFLSFAPKWFSDDGRDFTLIFTGGGRGFDNDSFNAVRGTFELRADGTDRP